MSTDLEEWDLNELCAFFGFFAVRERFGNADTRKSGKS